MVPAGVGMSQMAPSLTCQMSWRGGMARDWWACLSSCSLSIWLAWLPPSMAIRPPEQAFQVTEEEDTMFLEAHVWELTQCPI